MNSMKNALLKSMTGPPVLNVSATSGIAARIAVDDAGARNPQNEHTAVMAAFRLGEKRL